MLKNQVIFISLLICLMIGNVYASVSEQDASLLAEDFNYAISSATNVIGDLQPAINTGSIYAERLKPDVILKDFYTKFKMNSGQAFETDVTGLIGEYRKHLENAISEVLLENEERILTGDNRSFVPAFFRASVLKKINKAMKGILSGYATTSDRNLINKNSNVNTLLNGSPLLKEASDLVQNESAVRVDKLIAGHYMSYRPMTLNVSCIACHNQKGLQQQAEGYGGALIIDIKLN